MNARFDEPVWMGVVRRLSEVERAIPDAPAWRRSTDADTGVIGSVRLGGAFGRRATPQTRGARLVRVLLVVGALLALVGAAILAGSQRTADLRAGPFGPLGVLRGSDGDSRAALLPDGRVLIVSGEWSGFAAVAVGRADIWTPDGVLVPVDPPVTARVNPTVTLLLDGRVLVVGGYGGQYQYPSSAIASAEVWDPETETFTPTGSMAAARVRHTATLLQDGRVLIVGGSGPGGPERTAEIWDPATGTFTRAGTLVTGRAGHASVLSGNEVLVAGGRDAEGNGVGLIETWISTFVPRTDYVADPPHVSATRLLDGAVLLVGVDTVPYAGEGGFGGVAVLRSALPRQYTQLSRPRDGHAATLLENGDVLVTGGRLAGSGEPLDSAELWDVETESFRDVAALPIAAAGHDAILLPDGRILIILDATGPDGFVTPIAYDPNAP